MTFPRITVRKMVESDDLHDYAEEFELGDGATNGEMLFWLKLGYSANVSHWNGQRYESTCNYLPGDL